MSAPTNITALTAVDLGTLPASVTQDVADGATIYNVWYSYTAKAADNVLSIWGHSDDYSHPPTTAYVVEVRIYLGPASSPVLLVDLSTGNRVMQWPVTPGVTYFIECRKSTGIVQVTPAILHLSVESFVNVSVRAGSIVVPDDFMGMPLSILDGENDNTVLRFVAPFPAGDSGDVLADGISLVEDFNQDTDVTTVGLYSAHYSLIASPSIPGGSGRVEIRTSNAQNLFYVSRDASPVGVSTVDSTGALGATSWSLVGTTFCRALASNNAGTILYYASGYNSAVSRWDLVTDMALSDLVASRGENYRITSMLVLSDDTLVVLYAEEVAPAVDAKHYDVSGSTLHTYTSMTGAISSGGFAGVFTQLAYAIDDPDTFWVWFHRTGAVSRFQNIEVSSGSVLAQRDSTEYEEGLYAGLSTPTPASRFGNSQSCPFWITRTSLPPPFPPFVNGPAALEAFEGAGLLVAFDVPRVRVVPHLADENQRLFYSKFQLDCECGSGLVTGQGVDPVILLRYSDDGGFTWSSWRQLTTGALGVYRWRCIAWRLGMARDRVFMIRQTDPVKSAWLTAYIDFEGADA